LMDNTDRNRTSPFAFTGNKFEMRGVGSKTNCAKPMTVLNTIMARQLEEFKTEVDTLIEKKKLRKDEAIFNVLREYIKASKRIRFDGDGYSAAWKKEAAKRKLSNNTNTPQALEILTAPDTLELFGSMGVLTETEIRARQEVELETYSLNVQIEGRVIGELVYSYVIPAVVEYQNQLLQNVSGLKEVFGVAHKKMGAAQLGILQTLSTHLQALQTQTDAMIEARKQANAIAGASQKARAYCETVLPFFEEIRYHSDRLERLVGDAYWPLAKYRELLSLK
ncbi:MAG: glutamine synthetase type III, partial [Robiginitalea sp.]